MLERKVTSPGSVPSPAGDRFSPTRAVAQRAGHHEEDRRIERRDVLATGTLACRSCDAPVHPGLEAVGPAAQLSCPVCGFAAPAREFLSLAAPARPARVLLRVRPR